MRIALLCLLGACIQAPIAEPAEAAKTVVLKAARMFDGRTLTAPGLVVVAAGKIFAAGASANIPPGAEVIDLGDATLLPGFIDAHTHLTDTYTEDWKQGELDRLAKTVAERALDATANLRATLMAGFTTCRDLGSENFIDVGLRNATRGGNVEGPRMLVAVRGIGATGGHCDNTGYSFGAFGRETGVQDGVVNSADEARTAVRFNVKYGADVIKTCATGGVLSLTDDVDTPQLTQEELNALVDEAHALRRRTAAHAHGATGAKRAIRAGIDSIEHGSFLDDEALEMMRGKGTFLVPTLTASWWIGDRMEHGAYYPPAIAAKARAAIASHGAMFRKAQAKGVRIGFGTDAGVYPHGRNAKEFELMVALGMKPIDALKTATSVNAELLGVAETLGTLEAGKLADVIAVPGDSAADILQTAKVFFVMKEGVIHRNERPQARLSAQEDRQRMMDLLHIASLRAGADGRNSQAPNAANYDEAKANPYPNLPDPLVMKDGKKVTTAEMWWKRRRPEIVADFDSEIYGSAPRETPAVAWEVTKTAKETVGEIAVVTKNLAGRVDNSAYPQITVDIQMTLTTPANASGPVPVIMEFGFIGGFPRRPGEPAPPAPAGPTWQQQVLAKGWGYAILSPNSIQADNGQGLTQGVIGLVNKGQPRQPGDWGALRAWAWGASRALDYFETDPSVDAKRIGIEGHSRYGKAAIVAMAYDPRFAIVFASSSGEGGVKLHRRNWGELVENVAGTSEYHWMAGNFLKYAGPLNWNDLPVDSHELVALCAPRPVFISAGATQGDGWVDAKGMFLAGAGAGAVYRLLGKKDLGTSEFPPIETALIDGEVGFRQHSGGHTPAPNWPVFLKFAERYLGGPASIGKHF